jgi:predicted RNase H-like nuclease (RuvC/YqgF family)
LKTRFPQLTIPHQAKKDKDDRAHAKEREAYRAENLRLREAFKPEKIKVAEELSVQVKSLKRKCADYEERLENLVEENDELQTTVDGNRSSFELLLDRTSELARTKERLKQADREWEAEHREKLRLMDELEYQKKRCYSLEMLSRERGLMPAEEDPI